MAHPAKTYELILTATTQANKNRLKDWLSGQGIDSFVEGVIDDLDIDHEYTPGVQHNFFEELGGDLSPISIFKFDLELIEDLRTKILAEFASEIAVEVRSMETKTWMDGWKDSFKPISTKKFLVIPPWEKPPESEKSKFKIVIEPGMAFGTGQHATTKLCLLQLEEFSMQQACKNLSLIDVGTGTGILALAASKLGFYPILCTDIDPDAIIASKYNFTLNQTELPLEQTDVPLGKYDFVVANILSHVLVQLMPKFAKAVLPNGRLLLSGILADQDHEVLHAAKEAGFQKIASQDLEGWTSILLRKI